MTRERIGIMGGTFDPIHNGHLILAEYSRTEIGLDKILFIPTGKPPHKVGNQISKAVHRYNMTLLALDSNPNFFTSTIEMEREGFSYTIDTIRYLSSKFKDKEFYFILGSDSLLEIHKWKDYEELLKSCNFIVAKRKGLEDEELMDRVNDIIKCYKANIHILEFPIIDISSTEIRNRVIKNKSIKYLVPEPVELYIYKYGLYKENGNDGILGI
ncbi:nicotinate-nucleotide adenylyltransferase [Tepidimicrobium xylanilyticum]|uniref:Probable nicotinate-nucleotide adenylyltransferase n=1 Tax=Tepidimicrobium xylanilyticum TaxID=1123352 RepID=A0A1H3BUC3_9FIRM|nr:nicotinate-nucleotide adenylyltransferase [Tepidimicrobium xylanilyticum]SDX44809.1 nicotinate-nucleotide adenylyltransferase [Tepidimicrobium xylanilyticum]